MTGRLILQAAGLLAAAAWAAEPNHPWTMRVPAQGTREVTSPLHVQLARQPAEKILPGRTYLFIAKVGIPGPEGAALLSCASCRIEAVGVEGKRLGRNLDKTFSLGPSQAGKTISVLIRARDRNARPGLRAMNGSEAGLLAALPDPVPRPSLDVAWARGPGGRWILAGRSTPGRLHLDGRDFGEVDSLWERHPGMESSRPIQVRLETFYGDSTLFLERKLVEYSAKEAPGLDSRAQPSGGPLSRSSSFSASSASPFSPSPVPGPAASPAPDTELELAVSQPIWDASGARAPTVTVKVPRGLAWELAHAGSDYRMRGTGTGTTQTLPVAIGSLDAPPGLSQVLLKAGSATRAASVFLLKPGDLKAGTDKAALDPARNDSIVFTPAWEGAAFSLRIYDQDWRLVHADSAKPAFSWKGTTRSGPKALEGIYRCEISGRKGDETANALLTVVVAAGGRLPRPTLKFLAGKDTLYVDDSAVVVSWIANGKTHSDTILPGGYGPIVRSAERFGVKILDTLVIRDTLPPVIRLDKDKLNLLPDREGLPLVITRADTVSIAYTVRGIPARLDTVLPEGIHRLSVKSTDLSGNTSVLELFVQVDRTPPRIEIADTVQSKDKQVKIEFVVDGKPRTLDTTLTEGLHVIVIKETDAAGNVTERKVTVEIRTTVVLIAEPGEGDTVHTRTGRFTVRYTVDGSPRTLDTLLPAGPASLVIRGGDGQGNQWRSDPRTFTVVSPFPSVKALSPGKIVYTLPIPIVFTWSDTVSPVVPGSLKAWLDGTDVSARFRAKSDTARWDLSEPKDIRSGDRRLIVSIRNEALNAAYDTLRFFYSHVEARPSVSPDSGPVPLNVVFQTRAFDPAGTVEWYRWDFDGDGTVDNAVNSQQVAKPYAYTYTRPGVYLPSLEVISNRGEKHSDTLRVVATDPKPVAMAEAHPSNGGVPLEVRFQGRSTDAAGYTKYHEFDFDGDGKYDTLLRAAPDTLAVASHDFETGLDGWVSGGTSGGFGRPAWNRGIDSSLIIPQPGAMAPYDVRIASPAIALPASRPCSLHYKSMYTGAYIGDSLHVFVELDGSDTRILGSGANGAVAAREKADLSAFAGRTIRLKLRALTGASSRLEWKIDSLAIFSVASGSRDTAFRENGGAGNAWSSDNALVRSGRGSTAIPPVSGFGAGYIENDPDSVGFGNSRDSWFTSPSLPLARKGGTWLYFWHFMDIRNTADGGWVEASVDGGEFKRIAPVAGYPSTILNQGPGWAAANTEYRSAFDLTQASGDSIRIRFRFISNATGPDGRGWVLDSIRFVHILPEDISKTATFYAQDFEDGDGGWTAEGTPGVWRRETRAGLTDSVWATHHTGLPENLAAKTSALFTDTLLLPEASACTLQFRHSFTRYSAYPTVSIQPQGQAAALLAQFTANAKDSLVKLDLSAHAGKRVRFAFNLVSYVGGPQDYGWEIDNLLVTADGPGGRGIVWSDSVEGSTRAWTTTGTQPEPWVRRPKSVPGSGSGWMQLTAGGGEYPANAWARLTSPAIDLDAGTLTFGYRQYMNMEAGRDGGWLELSAEGGAFTPINPVEGYGWNLKIPGQTTNRPGFSGLEGWGNKTFNLSAYAGKRIRLRFVMVSDSANHKGRWLIDSLRIFDTRKSSRVTRIYPAPGTFNAAFRATNNFGQSAVAPGELTRVRAGAAGSPTAFASVDVQEGKAPLKANFRGWGRDPDGSIVRFEWDFDGDGKADTTLRDSGNVTYTYAAGGVFRPILKVVDNDQNGAKTGEDELVIRVLVQPVLTIAEADRTFAPGAGESASIRTVLNGAASMRLVMKDSTRNTVRELVPWTDRAAGTYLDAWNGKDEQGAVQPVGVYHAVLQYRYAGGEYTLDLSDTTGGDQLELSKTFNKAGFFKPFADEPLAFTFTLPAASEVTAFMGYLGVNQRIRTLIERQMYPAGTHTITWDGLDDYGRAAITPAGESIIFGGWTYTLPDNGLYISAPRPEITLVNADPNYSSPFTQVCSIAGAGIRLAYTLSEACPRVKAVVMEPKDGTVVAELDFKDVAAGANTVFWSAKRPDGSHFDTGIYRFGLKAFNAQGRESMFRYTLIRLVP